MRVLAPYRTLSCFAARARAAGPEDAGEARLVEDIARRTGKELESALAETTSLVDSLTRELRIIVELPGRGAGVRANTACVWTRYSRSDMTNAANTSYEGRVTSSGTTRHYGHDHRKPR
jgi:hypothetical protein